VHVPSLSCLVALQIFDRSLVFKKKGRCSTVMRVMCCLLITSFVWHFVNNQPNSNHQPQQHPIPIFSKTEEQSFDSKGCVSESALLTISSSPLSSRKIRHKSQDISGTVQVSGYFGQFILWKEHPHRIGASGLVTTESGCRRRITK
jgi:hypothetical protein